MCVVVDLLREQNVIQSEKVYKICWDINPHYFSPKSVKESGPASEQQRGAFAGFAEEEATYSAEEWAEAMVIFIGIMEQLANVRIASRISRPCVCSGRLLRAPF